MKNQEARILWARRNCPKRGSGRPGSSYERVLFTALEKKRF